MCAVSSDENDEETPPTSRSPVFAPPSGVRITVDVDDRAVASVVLPELALARAEVVRTLDRLDGLIADWTRRAVGAVA